MVQCGNKNRKNSGLGHILKHGNEKEEKMAAQKNTTICMLTHTHTHTHTHTQDATFLLYFYGICTTHCYHSIQCLWVVH